MNAGIVVLQQFGVGAELATRELLLFSCPIADALEVSDDDVALWLWLWLWLWL